MQTLLFCLYGLLKNKLNEKQFDMKLLEFFVATLAHLHRFSHLSFSMLHPLQCQGIECQPALNKISEEMSLISI